MNIRILGHSLEAWTLAAALSSTGCQVMITADQLPDERSEIAEPDLLRLLHQQFAQGRLELIGGADTAFVLPECELLIDARKNLSAEQRFPVLQALAHHRNGSPFITYALIQPVAVGTTDQLQRALNVYLQRQYEHQHEHEHQHQHEQQQQSMTSAIHCVFWPAFVESGRALDSFTRSGRVIIGGDQAEAVQQIRQLMLPFNRSQDASMVMTSKEAELTKIAINGMLATRISFMNELATLASQQGVDIEPVRQGIGSDPRIGHQYLYPGCGFGGDAFLNTLGFLSQTLSRDLEPELTAQDGGLSNSSPLHFSLLDHVQAVNRQQKDLLFQKFWRYFNADISGRTVSLWGCAFKPNTSSVAGSPALTLLKALLAHKVCVNVYDPMAMNGLKAWLVEHIQPDDQALVQFCHSPEQAAEHADGIMLVTEWKLFWNLNLAEIAKTMTTPLLLDGRNIYPPDSVERAGFIYSAIGRGQAL